MNKLITKHLKVCNVLLNKTFTQKCQQNIQIKNKNQGELKVQPQVSSCLTEKGKLEMSGNTNISLENAEGKMFAVCCMVQNENNQFSTESLLRFLFEPTCVLSYETISK